MSGQRCKIRCLLTYTVVRSQNPLKHLNLGSKIVIAHLKCKMEWNDEVEKEINSVEVESGQVTNEGKEAGIFFSRAQRWLCSQLVEQDEGLSTSLAGLAPASFWL